jgi:hypothetical protein
MALRDWTRDELIVAFNLYCKLPFGRLHAKDLRVRELAAALGRTPGPVATKLVNLAALDPTRRRPWPSGRGKATPGGAVTLVREALQGVLDGLARKPPVVGTLAAGRVADALAVLPEG